MSGLDEQRRGRLRDRLAWLASTLTGLVVAINDLTAAIEQASASLDAFRQLQEREPGVELRSVDLNPTQAERAWEQLPDPEAFGDWRDRVGFSAHVH